MKRILIIGQAPPAKPQDLPYDSTQLYDWLSSIGISKEQAQYLFVFEAMVPMFTGRNNTNSGHKKPFKKDMESHFKEVLTPLIKKSDKVILLGAVPTQFLSERIKSYEVNPDVEVLSLIHPSRRNIFKFRQNKDEILAQLNNFIIS